MFLIQIYSSIYIAGSRLCLGNNLIANFRASVSRLVDGFHGLSQVSAAWMLDLYVVFFLGVPTTPSGKIDIVFIVFQHVMDQVLNWLMKKIKTRFILTTAARRLAEYIIFDNSWAQLYQLHLFLWHRVFNLLDVSTNICFKCTWR